MQAVTVLVGVIWWLPALVSCHLEQASINEFNLTELDLYNEMVSCLVDFKSDFVSCNKNSKQTGMCSQCIRLGNVHIHVPFKANSFFQVINENSTVGGIIKCCGIWQVRDCWMKHATANCTDYVEYLPFKLLPKLDRWCNVYHDRTLVCQASNHLVPLVIVMAIILITIVSLACFLCRRQYKRVRLIKHASVDHANNNDVI